MKPPSWRPYSIKEKRLESRLFSYYFQAMIPDTCETHLFFKLYFEFHKITSLEIYDKIQNEIITRHIHAV